MEGKKQAKYGEIWVYMKSDARQCSEGAVVPYTGGRYSNNAILWLGLCDDVVWTLFNFLLTLIKEVLPGESILSFRAKFILSKRVSYFSRTLNIEILQLFYYVQLRG